MTVEELREKVRNAAYEVDSWPLIDSLIAAVEERTKEKIRKAGVPVSNVTFDAHGNVMRLTSDGADRMPSYFVPASAVALKETTCDK